MTLAGLVSLNGINAVAAESLQRGAAKVDFNREIRPILTENCYKCHGPDDGARKAKLRFDLREAALKPAKSGKVAIVRGWKASPGSVANRMAASAGGTSP